MFYYTHTEKARINQISPGNNIKARISQKQPGTMTINCAV